MNSVDDITDCKPIDITAQWKESICDKGHRSLVQVTVRRARMRVIDAGLLR